ncbi:MAG TPA: lysophospholipid acyltransferase family protein [Terracidiphilus sp.]|nr:lysophospholipid acyltransferase family protein [Terracidiphilus sp.]
MTQSMFTSRRPDPMPRYHRWRTNVLQAPFFFTWTALCGSCSLFFSLFEKSGRIQHAVARIWARGSLFFAGGRLTVRGAERLRQHPVAVYAANHTSYMDTPVVFSTLPFQFRILAKRELWTLPFIGWHLNRSGQIPIDTENTHTTLSSLGAGVKALRAGMPLFVFPEGSRTPDGSLKPFLAGAAFLAIRAQVPLVPIALKGVYDLLPIHTRHFYPCDVTLTVGEPIPTTGMTIRQADELTARLRTAIEEMLAEQHAQSA